MVRGIYQTSDAGERPKWVVFGMSVAFVLILVGTICWAIQTGGSRICAMPGYNASATYAEHARGALSASGYGYGKVVDKGDWPNAREYCAQSSKKIRRFIVTDLNTDSGYLARAEVLVEFDGGASSCWRTQTTTVKSYKPL